MKDKEGRRTRPARLTAAVIAAVCTVGMIGACSGCGINDLSSSFRSGTNEVKRKADELPRDPDFSPVFEKGG